MRSISAIGTALAVGLAGLIAGPQIASATLSTGFHGSATDGWVDAPCPSQSTLTGLRTSSDSYVEGMAPLCTPIPLPGSASVPPAAGAFYGGGTLHDDICPPDQSMVGANGGIGSWLDQIQVVCRAVASDGSSSGPTTALAVRGGNGGGAVSDLCQAPQAAVGIRIYTDDVDQYVAGIALDCERLSYPDRAAPETTITSGPRRRTRKRRATFGFTADEPGSSFECRLDGRRFVACGSPRTYRRLARIRHRFAVRARDSAGNTDPTPAIRRWRILPR